MRKYTQEIEEINKAIKLFNSTLIAKYHIPLFSIVSDLASSTIVKIVHQDWDAFPFPNNGTSGVYFIFGHEKTQTEHNGLYIGKASFGAKTSDRLYAHMHPNRNNEYFTMNGHGSQVFIADYIASIDLDKTEIPFMASALEEFLISALKRKLHLINSIGN